MSMTHKAGDEYGGQGVTEAAFDALAAVFIIDHFAVGAMTSVRDNQPWDWWDTWSIGPVIALYADPNASQPRVAGSALPFVRMFGLIGETQLYQANTTYTIGGELGIAIMAAGQVSIDIAVRGSHEWITGVRQTRYGGDPPPVKDIGTRMIRLSVGLSGFID